MSSSLHQLTTYISSHFLRECLNPDQAIPFEHLNTILQDNIYKALNKTKNKTILSNNKILYYNRCLFDLESNSLDGLLFCDNAIISFSPLHPFRRLRIVMYEEIVSTSPIHTNIHAAHYHLPEVLVRLKSGSVVHLSVEKDYCIYQLDALLTDIRRLITSCDIYPRFLCFKEFVSYYQCRLKRNPIILQPAYFEASRLNQFLTFFDVPSGEQMMSFIELIRGSFESGILFTNTALYIRLPHHPFMRLPYNQIIDCQYNGDKHRPLNVFVLPHCEYNIQPLELIFNHKIQADQRYMEEMFIDIIKHPSLFHSNQENMLAN